MTDTTNTPTAVTDLTARLGITDQRRAARIALQARIDDKVIGSENIRELIMETENLVDSMMVTTLGSHPEGRILAVVGEPGAGKTWAVQHALGKVLPSKAGLIETTAPAPCTPKTLGRNLLFALHYELTRDLPEHIIWERVRAQLKATCTRIVWIDEMHHALTSSNPNELTKVSETLKNLVQQRDWPVSLILSGRSRLSEFIGRDLQLTRRSQTVFFNPLVPEHDGEEIREVMKGFIMQHAKMGCSQVVTDEFTGRVIYAAEGGLGNVITLTRQAIYRAFDRAGGDATVEPEDFAMVYRRLRGAEDDQNVFLVPKWSEIVLRNSRLRRGEQPDSAQTPQTAKKKKGAK